MFRDDVRKFYQKRRTAGHSPRRALDLAKYDARYHAGSKKLDIFESRRGAYEGTRRTELPNGWYFTVEFRHDSDSGPPWKDCEGHGVITETFVAGYRPEHMDDWLLYGERGHYRYYDWKASLKLAVQDGWDAVPYNTGTKYEQAMRAVKSDYEYLRRWCNEEWWYVGMIIKLHDDRDTIIAEDACWGYESCCMGYLADTARTQIACMIFDERKCRRNAALQERIANRFRDAMECGV